jgi:UDP-N-acetylmuramate dehydrogenase
MKPKQPCAHSTAELTSVLEQNKSANKFILGGGSNMLLTKDIDALVIHIDLKGKRITAEMKIMFGSVNWENWHEFVLWTIDQNFGGWKTCPLFLVM